MYIVARIWTNNEGSRSLMSEVFHSSIDEALTDYNERVVSGNRDLIVAKVLPVKTVLVDYDVSGEIPIPMPVNGDL